MRRPRDEQGMIDQLRDAHRKSRELARQTMDLAAQVARLRKEWERRPRES